MPVTAPHEVSTDSGTGEVALLLTAHASGEHPDRLSGLLRHHSSRGGRSASLLLGGGSPGSPTVSVPGTEGGLVIMLQG